MSREIIDGAPIYRGRLRDLLDGAFGGQRRDRREGHQRQHRLELAHLGLQRRNHGARPHRLGRQSRRRDHGPQPRSAEQHPDGRGQPRHVLRMGPQGPFTPSRSPYHADTDGNNVPAYNEPNTAIGDGTGTMGLQRAGRRARHAAGQHSQFDPEPDDLPAIAVQRPRRLVLHGEQTRRPRIRGCGVPRRPFSTPALRATRSRDPISGAFPPETTRSPTAAPRRITTKPASAPNGTGTPTKTAGAAGKTPATTTRWPATSTTRTTSR